MSRDIYLQMCSLPFPCDPTPERLREISSLGYAGIETFADFFGGMDAVTLKTAAAAAGLKILSAHLFPQQFPDSLKFVKELGAEFVVVSGSGYDSEASLDSALERLIEQSETCRRHGLRLCYHNHIDEFHVINGKTVFEQLIERTAPDQLCFELDTAWAYAAGADPVDLLRRFPGRFELVHLKEYDTVTGLVPFDPSDPALAEQTRELLSHNAPSGKGRIDWPAVFDAAGAQGCRYYIVERDNRYLPGDLDCAAEDIRYFKSI